MSSQFGLKVQKLHTHCKLHHCVVNTGKLSYIIMYHDVLCHVIPDCSCTKKIIAGMKSAAAMNNVSSKYMTILTVLLLYAAGVYIQ